MLVKHKNRLYDAYFLDNGEGQQIEITNDKDVTIVHNLPDCFEFSVSKLEELVGTVIDKHNPFGED